MSKNKPKDDSIDFGYSPKKDKEIEVSLQPKQKNENHKPKNSPPKSK